MVCQGMTFCLHILAEAKHCKARNLEDDMNGKSICPFSLKPIFLESTANQFFPEGTWCSSITPAQHAGGPGFNPQCFQYFGLFSAAVSQLKAKSLECVSSCALRVLVSQADVLNTHVRGGRHDVAAIDHCGVCSGQA